MDNKTFIIVISVIDTFSGIPNTVGYVTDLSDSVYLLDTLNERAFKESLKNKSTIHYNFIGNFAIVEGDIENRFYYIYSTLNPNIIPAFGYGNHKQIELFCNEMITKYKKEVDHTSVPKLTTDFANKFKTMKEYYNCW